MCVCVCVCVWSSTNDLIRCCLEAISMLPIAYMAAALADPFCFNWLQLLHQFIAGWFQLASIDSSVYCSLCVLSGLFRLTPKGDNTRASFPCMYRFLNHEDVRCSNSAKTNCILFTKKENEKTESETKLTASVRKQDQNRTQKSNKRNKWLGSPNTHTHTHARTHARTQSLARTQTRTRTHTHTHTCITAVHHLSNQAEPNNRSVLWKHGERQQTCVRTVLRTIRSQRCSCVDRQKVKT